MKNKAFIFSLFILFCVDNVFAQWYVTPEVGMSAIKDPNTTIGDVQWLPSWNAGIGIDYEFGSGWDISSGVSFSQKKWNHKTLTEEFSASYKGKNVTFSVPFLVKKYVPIGNDVRLFVAVGPYIGCSFSNKSDDVFCTLEEQKEQFYVSYHQEQSKYDSYFDWGVMAKVGIEVNNWIFNMGYDVDLTKIYEYEKIDAKYHTLSLGIGYRFRLPKRLE